MNIFNMSMEDFEKEMENFKGYLDTLSDGEFVAQLMICGAKEKYPIKRLIRQLFCKHEFTKYEHQIMIGYKEDYVICKKCGEFHKVSGSIPDYIPLSKGGCYGSIKNSSKTK